MQPRPQQWSVCNNAVPSTDQDKRARPSNPLGGGRHPQPATTTKITIEEMQKVFTTNTKNIYIKYNNKNRPANIKTQKCRSKLRLRNPLGRWPPTKITWSKQTTNIYSKQSIKKEKMKIQKLYFLGKYHFVILKNSCVRITSIKVVTLCEGSQNKKQKKHLGCNRLNVGKETWLLAASPFHHYHHLSHS